MDTSSHTMESLFMQLGLDSNEKAIAEFISTHHLTEHETLGQASFWSPAQSQFIQESWESDSDWVVIIDQLDAQLHD